MASYRDVVPKFREYVQQQPVELMMQVGMEKQKQYNEGYQKIQSTIDKIAGLDVIRGVDKKYLQSKIDELGSNLRMVAGGDFSNFQLVNSIGGMVNQVGKDPLVQNAVASTAWYRKQMTDMEKAITSGKSSIQNQWDFNNKVSAWYNSDDINRSFNDRYTPYIDVQKKWLDVFKGLHSDLTEQDIPYVRNADGSINYNQTAAAMQRISKETVSAEKIENALRASLTPDELNQLSIDGRYQFRGFDTPEKVTTYATTKYNKLMEDNNARIKELEGFANMASSDPKKKKQAEDAIESLKKNNTQLSAQMKEEVDYIMANPEEAKATIYKNGAIAQFARSHAWEHNKSNFLTNPFMEEEHWRLNHALNVSKFNLDVRAQNWTEYKGKFDMMMSEKDFDLKLKKQMADLYGIVGGFETYLGENTNVKNPLSAIQGDITSLNTSANSSVREMAKGIGAGIDQVEAAIKLYNEGKTAEANRIIPVEWRDEVNQIINSRAQAKRLQSGLEIIEQDARNSPEIIAKKAQIDKTLSQLPPLTIGGTSFSRQEIFEFMKKQRSAEVPTVLATGTGAMGMGMGYGRFTSAPNYTEKEKILLNSISKGDKVAQGVISKYSPVYNNYQQFNQAVVEKRDQLLMERGGKYIPRVEAITFGSGEGNIARRTWESITSNALLKFGGGMAGTPGGDERMDESDREEAAQWLSGKDRDNIIFKKVTQGSKTYVMMINAGKEIFVPLAQNEVAQLPLSKNEPSALYQNVVEAQYFGKGSTNPTGKYEDAYFNRSFFPNVKDLNVKADLSMNRTNTAKQYITLMLNTEMGVLSLKLDDLPVSRDEAIKYVGNLTDSKIKSLFLSNDAVPNEWKEYIQNMK